MAISHGFLTLSERVRWHDLKDAGEKLGLYRVGGTNAKSAKKGDLSPAT
jgi:hypothetical protein